VTIFKAWHHLGLASAVLLGACATLPQDGAAPAATGEAETIAISVGPCFGFCPVYEAAIAPTGAVTFNGMRHTVVLGERQRAAGEASYRALAADLAPYRPQTGTTATVECEAAISDTSTYTITWTDPRGGKTVARHQRGCRGGPGQALDGLLQDLPARLGIEDWAKQITRPGESRG